MTACRCSGPARSALSRFLCGCVAVLVLAPWSALGWGDRGHQATGAVAFELLTPAAKAKVTRILGHMTLAQAATWPDDIRPDARLSHTDEARAFNARFPNNREWHYVNLPLGTTAFPGDHRLAHRQNIVEQIGVCLDVLEGRSRRMLPRHALCWLAHLVGDLHQPLHVGCGFFTFDADGRPTMITDPARARADQHDRGGNQILLPGNRRLHAYWDGEMVRAVWEASAGARLEALLLESVAEGLSPDPGPLRTWARNWALESVRGAGQAYRGITLGARTASDANWQIPAVWAPSEAEYRKGNRDLARQQLASAAFRLAEMLNGLRWK